MLTVFALAVISRLRGPTPAQAAALELINTPVPVEGRNAFAAMWLLTYDVPEAEQEAVAAEDVRRFNARPAGSIEEYESFTSVATGRYRDLTKPVDGLPKRCELGGEGCLASVRATPSGFDTWRAHNQRLIDRAGGLSAYAHYRNLFRETMDMPMPNFGAGPAARLTGHAATFVRGEQDVALAGVCGDVTTWRRLGVESDSLVLRMVASAIVRGSTRLFADMLAELPSTQALPKTCTTAFSAPTPAELSLCGALKGEFRFVRAAREQMNRSQNLWHRAFYSGHMTDARMAQTFAQACGGTVAQAIAGDMPVPIPAETSSWRFDCLGNYAGCVLSDIATPEFQKYQLRMQDFGAQLKLIGTVLWLREHADDKRPLALRLADRPAALRSRTREIEIVVGGEALRIRLFETRRSHFDLPLPQSLR